MSVAARIPELWHLLRARIALLTGRRVRARAALKRALQLNPNGFQAHFLLGRLYWRERSQAKAKREFDIAWQIDPRRFERAYGRLRSQRGGAPSLVPAEMKQDRGVRVTAHRGSRRPPGHRNEDERRRIRDLPPITREEIHEIDWDRLEDDLRGDDGLR